MASNYLANKSQKATYLWEIGARAYAHKKKKYQ